MAHSIDVPMEDIHAQLARICASSEIGNAKRLQEILNYIVHEALAGRTERIKGFTIGKAVFYTEKNFDAESNSIVRVEVGRLRQRLTEYYLTTGCDDPIVIDIPKGSYVPRFTQNHQATKDNRPSPLVPEVKTSARSIGLIVGTLVLLIGLAVSWNYNDSVTDAITAEDKPGKVSKFANNSEAQILFKQAFILMMPPEDEARLSVSQDLFQRVIEMDPGFPGGYAGKSLGLSIQVIFIKSKSPRDNLRQALLLAESAVDRDLEYPLGYAALALASSLVGDTDSALENVRRVISIQPHQATSNAMASLALILSGRPTNALELLDEALRLDPDESRAPYLNLIATANYVLRDYPGVVNSINMNLLRGGPTGAHMDVFLAASYAQMSKEFEAQAIMEKLRRTNPGFPLEQWLGNYIKSKKELGAIVRKLQSLGLSNS
jgi:tetratricopeptide (TPR) repeat protein